LKRGRWRLRSEVLEDYKFHVTIPPHSRSAKVIASPLIPQCNRVIGLGADLVAPAQVGAAIYGHLALSLPISSSVSASQ
jgi:hypothetical protein